MSSGRCLVYTGLLGLASFAVVRDIVVQLCQDRRCGGTASVKEQVRPCARHRASHCLTLAGCRVDALSFASDWCRLLTMRLSRSQYLASLSHRQASSVHECLHQSVSATHGSSTVSFINSFVLNASAQPRRARSMSAAMLAHRDCTTYPYPNASLHRIRMEREREREE